MKNYYQKYIKYKEKYLKLKMTGGNHKNMIALMWLNKTYGPIQHISNGVDLQIKDNLKRIYNKLKITYNNPDVILVLNFDKIIPEDFDFFNKNGVNCVDINKFNCIQDIECLDKMYNPSKYGFDDLEKIPIYVQVDMSKILIQYEYMVYENYDYVTFIDLDIKTSEDDLSSVICKPIRPDFTGELYPNKLLDSQTIETLDVFGYLMAGFSKPTPINARYQSDIDYEIENYGKPVSYILINDEYYSLNANSFENSFLMSKKTENTIKAIKEYFIDIVFCDIIYNSYISNKASKEFKNISGFIYDMHYIPFFIYLYFLNDLIYLNYLLDVSIEENNIFYDNLKKNFEIEKDYKIDEDPTVHQTFTNIKILNFNTFKYFIKKFGFPQSKQQHIIDKHYLFYFIQDDIPKNKLNLFINNMNNIIGNFDTKTSKIFPIPYKCIGVEPSKNLSTTKY
jgi:hypothetical protein